MIKNSSIRVRFAPSPTGYLHVGGARTALFNFLFARHENGQFLLRIEDTDKERSDPRMTESILDCLKWLGLSWDESLIFQSQQLNRHIEICQHLLESNQAYRCFCTPEMLASKREKAGDDTKYDRTCLTLSEEQIRDNLQNQMTYALRFKVPIGETTFADLIHGSICIQHQEIDDFVIQRSDGSPVYQIAVVADDHDMGITHVIRGDDHLSNTPKQILLYGAMGWEPPQFGHVPLILGPDKKRLSKRHGATSVEAYQKQGIVPEAMVNFLALLGWSPGDDREIMDLDSFIQEFSLERISKKSAVFDPQKLEWMNSKYIANADNASLVEILKPELVQAGWIGESMNAMENEYLNRILDLLKPRMKTMNDFMDQASCFYLNPETYEDSVVQKHWSNPEVSQRLTIILEQLTKCDKWEELFLESLIRDSAEQLGIGAGKLIHPIRLAITGKGSSPGLFEVMVLLGKEKVLVRLKKAIAGINI